MGENRIYRDNIGKDENGVKSMIPYIVAIVEGLFYLMCVPVHLALVFEGGAGLKVGAGVSAFAGQRARRRAASDLSGGSKKSGPEPGRVWSVLRRMRFERMEIYGTLGLGDAASTALLCGAVNGAFGSLRGRAAHFRADVRPDFSSPLRVELRGMLTARTGQIIRAILFERKT